MATKMSFNGNQLPLSKIKRFRVFGVFTKKENLRGKANIFQSILSK